MARNILCYQQSATPNANEEAKIKKVAEWLKANPKAEIELVGYADAGTGTADVNLRISEKRVNKVVQLLINTASKLHASQAHSRVTRFSRSKPTTKTVW